MITSLNVVTLYVADPLRSLDFFVRQLGFQKKTEVEMSPGRWWREIAPPEGGTAVALLRAADFDRAPVPGLTFTLYCDDVDATVAELRATGIDVAGPRQEPWGTFAQFTDPDGHLFILGSQKAGQP
jgi:catechol 2,3-dioxygenase-like lactoylglutathione lyase family enzyme